MKTKFLIILLMCSTVFTTSCDSESNAPDIETLSGIWNLKTVRGGLQGLNCNYESGLIVWEFITIDNTLIVKNNIPADDELSNCSIRSGSYTYEIRTNGDSEVLYIEIFKEGTLSLSKNNLIIDGDIASDGLISTFQGESF